MGYHTRSISGIRDFTPDNTVNDLWLPLETGMDTLLESFHAHFGEDAQLSDFTIAPEHIHTHCLSYDRYDAGDWTNYLHIFRNK